MANGRVTAGQLVLTKTRRNDDAFGRFRASTAFERWAAPHTSAQLSTEKYNSTTSGGGTVTFNGTRSVGEVETFNTGDKAVEQSFEYVNYWVGCSTVWLITGNLNYNNASTTGMVARMGVYDDAADKSVGSDSSFGNGYFLELSDGTLKVVQRSSITGSQVDTSVSQASWNLDTMDGNGASGLTLDTTKNILLGFEFSPFGGCCTLTFFFDDQFVRAHRFEYANDTSPPLQTHSLPFRWEAQNVSAGSLTYEVDAGCGSCVSEALVNNILTRKHFGMTTTATIDNITIAPILSVRLNASATRAKARIIKLVVLVDSPDGLRIWLIKNGTLTGASFSAVSGTALDADTSATAISGGIDTNGGFLIDTFPVLQVDLDRLNVQPIVSDIAGNSDVITVAAINEYGSSNASVAASIDWLETY